MAMTAGSVRGSVSVQIQGATWPAQGVANAAVNTTIIGQNYGTQQALKFGTSSAQGNLIVFQAATLASTTAATYDLYTGTDLKDMDGNTAAFRHVKEIFVFVLSGGDATGVAVGGAGSNCWPAFFSDPSDIALIYPSGLPYCGGSPAGSAVGTSTKAFKVNNLGAVSVTLLYVICGTTT